jgi:hypothetical protein
MSSLPLPEFYVSRSTAVLTQRHTTTIILTLRLSMSNALSSVLNGPGVIAYATVAVTPNRLKKIGSATIMTFTGTGSTV